MPDQLPLPNHDCWIELAPNSAGVVLDGPLMASWQDRTAESRAVRGNVLTAAFELEYALDRVLALVLFTPEALRGHSLIARATAINWLTAGWLLRSTLGGDCAHSGNKDETTQQIKGARLVIRHLPE